jgi:hypothetical protein
MTGLCVRKRLKNVGQRVHRGSFDRACQRLSGRGTSTAGVPYSHNQYKKYYKNDENYSEARQAAIHQMHLPKRTSDLPRSQTVKLDSFVDASILLRSCYWRNDKQSSDKDPLPYLPSLYVSLRTWVLV